MIKTIARGIVTGVMAGVVFWTLFVITMHVAQDQFFKGARWATEQCPKQSVFEGVDAWTTNFYVSSRIPMDSEKL